MNIGDNHKYATRSVEADRIEDEIDSIEGNIVALIHEFLKRVKRTFSIIKILESNTIFIISIVFFILIFVFRPFRRKSMKYKVVRVDKQS